MENIQSANKENIDIHVDENINDIEKIESVFSKKIEISMSSNISVIWSLTYFFILSALNGQLVANNTVKFIMYTIAIMFSYYPIVFFVKTSKHFFDYKKYTLFFTNLYMMTLFFMSFLNMILR